MPATILRAAAVPLVAGALSLPGCSPLLESARSAAEARTVGKAASAYLEELPAREGEHEVLEIESTRPYTGLVLLSTPKDRTLPARLQGKDGITVPLERALDSSEVAQPLGGAGAPRRVALLGAAVLGAVASVFWFGSLKSEEPAVETVTPPAVPEPVWIAEGVPPGPFLARCLDAQAAYPPVLPQMWRLRNLGCYADTSRRHELSQLAYEQGAMVATWKAAPGANRAMARQIAERRLELWPKGQVVGSEAWAAVRFERPVHEWEGEAPRAAEFRRSIDRALATVSDELRFSYSDGLSFEARTGLALAELGRRLEGIGWLDMHEAVWLEGKWTVKGGLVQRRLVSANEEG